MKITTENKTTGSVLTASEVNHIKTVVNTNEDTFLNHSHTGADLVLISPNGTQYRIVVSDTGALSTTLA